MSKHSSCPNCNSTDDGRKIYRCRKCGTVYCGSCARRQGVPFFEEPCCPDCKATGGVIGRIANDD